MRSHWGHGRFVAIPMVFLMLMMIKLIFSQAVMEIYAYNYISQCKVEKSVREDRIQLKSKQDNDKTASEKEKTEKKQTKENQTNASNANDETRNVQGSSSLAFSFLIPVEGGVTSSGFGDTIDRTSIHKGHDWAVPGGTAVRASESGVVELAYYSVSYGYNVLLRHSDSMETRYAHMSELYVKQGENVERGQTLGLSGNTGDSTGPHLHFEVIRNGVKINPLSVFR